MAAARGSGPQGIGPGRPAGGQAALLLPPIRFARDLRFDLHSLCAHLYAAGKLRWGSNSSRCANPSELVLAG